MIQPSVMRLAHAIVGNAFIVADMVATLLARMSSVRKSYPEPFLKELGAICQIKLWEDTGLLSHFSIKLPTYSTAMECLIHRLRTSSNPYPDSTKDIALVSLVDQAKGEMYFSFRLAAESPRYLTTINFSEEQLTKIADFLWNLRHLVDKKRAKENRKPKKHVCSLAKANDQERFIESKAT